MPARANGSICARAQNDTPSTTAAQASTSCGARAAARGRHGLGAGRNVRKELAQREHVACEVEAVHVHDVGRELA